jgi:hypothetical protein
MKIKLQNDLLIELNFKIKFKQSNSMLLILNLNKKISFTNPNEFF